MAAQQRKAVGPLSSAGAAARHHRTAAQWPQWQHRGTENSSVGNHTDRGRWWKGENDLLVPRLRSEALAALPDINALPSLDGEDSDYEAVVPGDAKGGRFVRWGGLHGRLCLADGDLALEENAWGNAENAERA
eukprot:Skav222318  [mRNA]  locus=scaffold1249:222229:228839:+ [translate_table: standard]